jgi:hypothetical protein
MGDLARETGELTELASTEARAAARAEAAKDAEADRAAPAPAPEPERSVEEIEVRQWIVRGGAPHTAHTRHILCAASLTAWRGKEVGPCTAQGVLGGVARTAGR